jgi:hypothetical protein
MTPPREAAPTPRPDDRLAEIRARCDAATGGPWAWHQDYGFTDDEGNEVYNWCLFNPETPDGGVGDGLERTVNASLVLLADYLRCADGRPLDEDPDFQFIAHARADIPWLLERVNAYDPEALKPEAFGDPAGPEWQRGELLPPEAGERLAHFACCGFRMSAIHVEDAPKPTTCPLCEPSDPEALARLMAENARLLAALESLDLAIIKAASSWPVKKENMIRLTQVAVESGKVLDAAKCAALAGTP